MEKKEISVINSNFVMSKINFRNVYEKRIAYAIIDSVSPFLKNQITGNIKSGKEISYQQGMFDIDEVVYKARDLEPNRQHYPLLRKALKDLKRDIDIKTKTDEICTSFVLKWKFDKHTENVKLNIDAELMQFLQDLSIGEKGFALLQMKTAISLSSTYTMKIYELICKWRGKKKFYIPIEELRLITNTVDKYSKVADFKKRVLNAAQNELKKHKETDLMFKYNDVKNGRFIVGFNIFPIKTKNSFEEIKTENEVSPRWFLSPELVNTLEKHNVLVKGKTLETIKKWSSEVYNNNDNDMIHQIGKYVEAAERKYGEGKNHAAFIMNCIKNEVK